jgi:hypothetical protein
MARLTPLWLQNGAFPASVDRRLIGALWPAGGVTGMAPTVVTGTMQIQIATGVAAVPDSRVIGAAYLCSSDAPENVTLAPAPPSGQDRIDLVVVRPRDSAYTGADNDWILDPIAGIPSANPAVPAVPAGTIAIAQQRVVGGAAVIVAANLVDRRGGGLSIAARGYVASIFGPPSTITGVGAPLQTVLSLTAVTFAGRRYKVSCFGFLAQQTVVGTPAMLLETTNIDSAQGRFINSPNVPPGNFAPGSAVFLHSPASTAARTWNLQATTTAGTVNVAQNQQMILLEDIGSQ